ncbi:GPI transamidase component family protein / Gaa1-like family protein isoform X2 [Tasmannia lanceolata]
MPGSANPMFSGQDITGANKLAKDILSWKFRPIEAGIEIPRLIVQHMEDVGAEVYYHKFYSQNNQFHPLHFFSGTPFSVLVHDNRSCTSVGVNSVGIIRAPRGDGKEAIVLVTPYNSGKIELSEALSLGLAYSIFSLLSRATWLAKDIVWLAADSRYGEYASVSAWLRDYHNPVFLGSSGKFDFDMCLEGNHQLHGGDSEAFRRAGTMAAALVFKIVGRQEETEKDTLHIYAEASNGQMPNLDLINIVQYLAVHRQGLRVKVETVFSLLNTAWLNFVGEILEWLSKIAGSLNPQWKFGIPVVDYVEGIATLASSMYYQALGVPTGSHGAFRDYQIDAITLEMAPKISLNSEIGQSAFLLRGGRLIEGVIRSVNNLLEKFHQSFFLYFLTSPSKFVSVGVYMIAFLLLVAPLPILAAALYSGNRYNDCTNKENQTPQNGCPEELGFAVGSWRWLHAAKVVFIIHIWAAIVSLLPYLICQLPERTSTASMLTWLILSVFILLILYRILGSPYTYSANATSPSQSQTANWTTLKAVTIAAASIGLGLMSIINFAAAQIGAVVLVPICLIVHPFKHMLRAASLRAVILMACNLVLLIVGFPPAALLILKGSSKEFGGVSIGDFWDWAESLWAWNSATYLYLALVHLPCWVLCIHILLHPL